MAIGKLFIGRKVREIRQASSTTQAQFADMIGISTSYLNQIENNQRPVSAMLMLRLSEVYDFDPRKLAAAEHRHHRTVVRPERPAAVRLDRGAVRSTVRDL